MNSFGFTSMHPTTGFNQPGLAAAPPPTQPSGFAAATNGTTSGFPPALAQPTGFSAGFNSAPDGKPTGFAAPNNNNNQTGSYPVSTSTIATEAPKLAFASGGFSAVNNNQPSFGFAAPPSAAPVEAPKPSFSSGGFAAPNNSQPSLGFTAPPTTAASVDAPKPVFSSGGFAAMNTGQPSLGFAAPSPAAPMEAPKSAFSAGGFATTNTNQPSFGFAANQNVGQAAGLGAIPGGGIASGGAGGLGAVPVTSQVSGFNTATDSKPSGFSAAAPTMQSTGFTASPDVKPSGFAAPPTSTVLDAAKSGFSSGGFSAPNNIPPSSGMSAPPSAAPSEAPKSGFSSGGFAAPNNNPPTSGFAATSINGQPAGFAATAQPSGFSTAPSVTLPVEAPKSAFSSVGFGAPSSIQPTSGFAAPPPAAPSEAPKSAFSSVGFGAPSNNQPSSGFSALPAATPSEAPKSGFGAGGFATVSNNQPSSGFSSAPVEAPKSGFSSVGFGAASNNQPSSGFSAPPSAAPSEAPKSGFGAGGFAAASNNQPSSGFSSRPSAAPSEAPKSGFGAGGFAAPATNQSNSGFSATPSSGQSSGFGAGGFGASASKTSAFGASAFGKAEAPKENTSGGFASGGSAFGAGGFGAASGQTSSFGAGGFGQSGGFGGDSKPGAERPRGCFNCGQDGHRSADCTEPKKPRGCFNCGEEGHRGSDCPHPRKPREGGGSNVCFNCQQEGHRSADCTEPKKVREGGNGCFNCGQDGHRSADCTEPRKPRDDGAPGPVTYVPEHLAAEELFKLQMDTGSRFSELFNSDVTCTSMGCAINLQPYTSFNDLHLTSTVQANLEKAGYAKPTPVQQYAMPIIDQGLDLMACAQTGSGKTAAFLLPIINKLLKDNDLAGSGPCAAPRCIIIAPTRELAVQIYNEGRKFTLGTVLKVECIYGGTQVGFARSRMEMGPSIVVGTMGRMMHFIESNIISLAEVRWVVIDEADRMLDTGSFQEDVRRMLGSGPPKEKRRTLMFSATFPEEVQNVAKENLRPEFALLAVDQIGSANKCITQAFIEVPDRTQKREKLLELLQFDLGKYKINGESDIFKQKTLVFVNRKTLADQLGIFFSEHGLASTTMHGDRDQKQRNEALSDFRMGRKPVLIATAVAERGLDIQGVDHVINYDLPDSKEDYVHRIGRTGRVGNPGRATSFFDQSDSNDLALAPHLVTVLAQAEQVVPEWLKVAGGAGMPGSGFGSSVPTAADDEEWDRVRRAAAVKAASLNKQIARKERQKYTWQKRRVHNVSKETSICSNQSKASAATSDTGSVDVVPVDGNASLDLVIYTKVLTRNSEANSN
ncbi:unnamed protein product, partial [Mesorhabditis spiculigera]